MKSLLKALSDQCDDIRSGSTASLPIQFGHAVGVIAQVGRDEFLCGEGTEEAQIERMRAKTRQEIIKFGPEVLNFLRPELRALVQPDDMPKLIEEHNLHMANKERG